MKLMVLMNHNFSHTSAINDFFKIVQYNSEEANIISHSYHNRKQGRKGGSGTQGLGGGEILEPQFRPYCQSQRNEKEQNFIFRKSDKIHNKIHNNTSALNSFIILKPHKTLCETY